MRLSSTTRTRENINGGNLFDCPQDYTKQFRNSLVRHLVPRTMELLIREQLLCNLACRSDHSETTMEELLVFPFLEQFRIVNWLDTQRVVTQISWFKALLECWSESFAFCSIPPSSGKQNLQGTRCNDERHPKQR